MHKQISVLLLCLLPLASCTETRVPNPAPVLTPGDGGKFGHWTMDSALGPVFNYTRPEGVTYTTSYGTSDLHMHLIGNQSLNAFVRPEGGADIIIRDPGLMWLTRDPIRQAHLADGAAVVLPDGQRIAIPSAGVGATSTTEAEFGLGFVRFAPTQVRSGSVELEITRTLQPISNPTPRLAQAAPKLLPTTPLASGEVDRFPFYAKRSRLPFVPRRVSTEPRRDATPPHWQPRGLAIVGARLHGDGHRRRLRLPAALSAHVVPRRRHRRHAGHRHGDPDGAGAG